MDTPRRLSGPGRATLERWTRVWTCGRGAKFTGLWRRQTSRAARQEETSRAREMGGQSQDPNNAGWGPHSSQSRRGEEVGGVGLAEGAGLRLGEALQVEDELDEGLDDGREVVQGDRLAVLAEFGAGVVDAAGVRRGRLGERARDGGGQGEIRRRGGERRAATREAPVGGVLDALQKRRRELREEARAAGVARRRRHEDAVPRRHALEPGPERLECRVAREAGREVRDDGRLGRGERKERLFL
mmetsp:Transcript_14195/g.56585  ORF Transcript_14195/g.56585 Transcript_14195/m.56585 type:complete len:243 (-) Transcript_14195:501-1229(-)